jgi:hypothetical protein
MIQKPTPKRDARTDGFIDSMLKSASEKTETSAQIWRCGSERDRRSV